MDAFVISCAFVQDGSVNEAGKPGFTMPAARILAPRPVVAADYSFEVELSMDRVLVICRLTMPPPSRTLV